MVRLGRPSLIFIIMKGVSYMKRGKLLITLVTVLTILLMSFCVYADTVEVDAVTNIGTGYGEVGSICSQANYVAGRTILQYTSDGLLKFSNKEYNELDMDTKRDFMNTALVATKETSLGSQVKNKVYNFIAEQDNPTSSAVRYLQSDASADFATAKSWLRPFNGLFGTVMGVMCLLIFIFIAITTLFDLGYLVLPPIQGLLERGEPRKRPFGVSREAWEANKEVESRVHSDKNIMSVYLGKRGPVVLIMCLCLGYVISGKMYDIVVYFIDAFSSVNIFG